MITTPIFTRLLTTQEYGEFNVFNSWLSIVTVFVTLNLYNGVFTRGLVKYEEDRDRYASALQGMCTLCILIGFAIYGVAHDFWNHFFEMTTTQALLMFIMIWATAVFNFWSVSQRVDFKYRALVIITLISSIAKPVLGIILVRLADDKVTARILGLALVEVVTCTGLFVAQLRRGKTLYVKKYWVHALHFNLPLIPHYLSQTVLNSSDRIMIQKMVSADAAGIYSLAYSISQIMTIFNTALLKTIEPWLYKKNESKSDTGHWKSCISVLGLGCSGQSDSDSTCAGGGSNFCSGSISRSNLGDTTCGNGRLLHVCVYILCGYRVLF